MPETATSRSIVDIEDPPALLGYLRSSGRICSDEMPEITDKWVDTKAPQNPHAEIPYIADNFLWLQTLYREVLKLDVDEYDSGVKDWMSQLNAGAPRDKIEQFFRQTAANELAKKHNSDFTNFLSKDDEGKRMLYVMPESLGDVLLSTSLFRSLKEQYPQYNLYVATKPENMEILEANPYIFRVIPYFQQMDNQIWLEGQGEHKGYFEIAFLPYVNTQRILTYLHNAKDTISYNIKY